MAQDKRTVWAETDETSTSEVNRDDPLDWPWQEDGAYARQWGAIQAEDTFEDRPDGFVFDTLAPLPVESDDAPTLPGVPPWSTV